MSKQGYQVHATDYILGDKLKALPCQTHQLDVRSPTSIQAFASSLTNTTSTTPIDLLLNVAGTMSPHDQDALETVSKETLTRIFETNTFGPLLLTQALLPCVLKAKENGNPNPRIAIVSSRVGSIADNSSGGIYAYRASKAAVNSIGKGLAMDLKDEGIVVSLLHPGFVRTGLDPSTHGLAEAVEPEEAARKLWGVLLSKGLEDTGKFWHREGQELPW